MKLSVSKLSPSIRRRKVIGGDSPVAVQPTASTKEKEEEEPSICIKRQVTFSDRLFNLDGRNPDNTDTTSLTVQLSHDDGGGSTGSCDAAIVDSTRTTGSGSSSSSGSSGSSCLVSSPTGDQTAQHLIETSDNSATKTTYEEDANKDMKDNDQTSAEVESSYDGSHYFLALSVGALLLSAATRNPDILRVIPCLIIMQVLNVVRRWMRSIWHSKGCKNMRMALFTMNKMYAEYYAQPPSEEEFRPVDLAYYVFMTPRLFSMGRKRYDRLSHSASVRSAENTSHLLKSFRMQS